MCVLDLAGMGRVKMHQGGRLGGEWGGWDRPPDGINLVDGGSSVDRDWGGTRDGGVKGRREVNPRTRQELFYKSRSVHRWSVHIPHSHGNTSGGVGRTRLSSLVGGGSPVGQDLPWKHNWDHIQGTRSVYRVTYA